MVGPVSGKKRHPSSLDLSNPGPTRGGAVWSVDHHLVGLPEKRVETGAAEDSDLRGWRDHPYADFSAPDGFSSAFVAVLEGSPLAFASLPASDPALALCLAASRLADRTSVE